jgi:hypothetical protein
LSPIAAAASAEDLRILRNLVSTIPMTGGRGRDLRGGGELGDRANVDRAGSPLHATAPGLGGQENQ